MDKDWGDNYQTKERDRHTNYKANDTSYLYRSEHLMPDLKGIRESRLDKFCDPLMPGLEPHFENLTIRQLTMWPEQNTEDFMDKRHGHGRKDIDVEERYVLRQHAGRGTYPEEDWD